MKIFTPLVSAFTFKPFTLLFFLFLSILAQQTYANDGISDVTGKSFYIDTSLENQATLHKAMIKQEDYKIYHFFSYGRPGELLIEGECKNPVQIKNWFLENQIDLQEKQLQIYGCEFGKSQKGKQAISYLERLAILHIRINN